MLIKLNNNETKARLLNHVNCNPLHY